MKKEVSSDSSFKSTPHLHKDMENKIYTAQKHNQINFSVRSFCHVKAHKCLILSCEIREITSHVPGYETETGRKWCCSSQCLKKYPFTSCFFFFCLGSVDTADFYTILIMIHFRDDDCDTWFVTYTLGNLTQKHKTATQEQNEKDLMLVWMKSPWYFTVYKFKGLFSLFIYVCFWLLMLLWCRMNLAIWLILCQFLLSQIQSVISSVVSVSLQDKLPLCRCFTPRCRACMGCALIVPWHLHVNIHHFSEHILLTNNTSTPTSLRDATALWRGVSHMLSLALTRAPEEENEREGQLTQHLSFKSKSGVLQTQVWVGRWRF